MNRTLRIAFIAAIAVAAVGQCSWSQATGSASAESSTFAPFQQWIGAVLTGDASALKSLYSTEPAAQVRVSAVMRDADADTGFWLGLKVSTMNVEIIRLIVRPDRASVIFRADVVSGRPDGHAMSVTDDQYWLKEGEQWRLVSVERTDAPRLKQPSDMKKDIYPASADTHAEIKEAEEKAARGRKRLLLVFGANWCFDCHVLDLAFQQPDLAAVLVANYEVVHVDIGPDGHKNGDVVQQYEIPLDKGVPAVAVADSDGKLIASQKNGEFEDARGLTPEVLLEFLNKWKQQAK
jgi:thioredoxin 1